MYYKDIYIFRLVRSKVLLCSCCQWMYWDEVKCTYNAIPQQHRAVNLYLGRCFLYYNDNERNDREYTIVQNLQQSDRRRRLSNFPGVQFLRLVRRVMREGSSVDQRS